MTDFQELLAATEHFPQHVVPWLTWMQIVLLLGPIVFIRYAAARWMILAQLLNGLIAYCVFVAEGNEVTRLFGLGHTAWVFPAWMFLKDVRSSHWKIYRIYAGIAAATILISLTFDAIDIGRWIAGDRTSVLEVPE